MVQFWSQTRIQANRHFSFFSDVWPTFLFPSVCRSALSERKPWPKDETSSARNRERRFTARRFHVGVCLACSSNTTAGSKPRRVVVGHALWFDFQSVPVSRGNEKEKTDHRRTVLYIYMSTRDPSCFESPSKRARKTAPRAVLRLIYREQRQSERSDRPEQCETSPK